MRVRKPIDLAQWATVAPDGYVTPCFNTKRDAIWHVTKCQGLNDRPCTWPEAKAAGWRVVKVRVTEVRR